MYSRSPQARLVLPMQRGPYQNNGASPWYCTLGLGTPAQLLKFSLDSGTNMNWITSTLCPADQCGHFAGGRFDYLASGTFSFTDRRKRPYSFGPWGTMQVEAAEDVLTLASGARLTAQLFMAAAYDGDQFRQLDWDGGIGLPCGSAYVEGRNTLMVQALMREGLLDPAQPFVAFDWGEGEGSCTLGAVDASKTQGAHLFLPWSVYNSVPGVEYIWSTELKAFSVGGQLLARDITFALDSGSSRFKGDDSLMRQTLQRIASSARPEVVLTFADGELTLGADIYETLIEEGPQKGQVLPQFAPLGLSDLVLVGSLVMEHCYTVYEYRVVECARDLYALAPVGVWLFNRPDGPQIITRSSARRFSLAARELSTAPLTLPGPRRQSSSIAGTWQNDYGSVMTLEVSGQQVFGTYRSSTGSTGEYPVIGGQLGDGATSALSMPIALAINWHSLGNGPRDPSWDWASGLSGQLSVTEAGDLLTLSHLLVATSDFPGLTDRGTFVDKLTYRRVAARIATPARQALSAMQNPLNGTWVAAGDTQLVLNVYASGQHRCGVVQGYLSSLHAPTRVVISGFTDINAQSHSLAQQSVSLTLVNAEDQTVSALCGALELAGDTLKLLRLTSSPVAPMNAYLATRISSISFVRRFND